MAHFQSTLLCQRCEQPFQVYSPSRARKAKFCSVSCGAHVPHPRHSTMEERFWAKVDKSGDCWFWLGGINRDGYGTFRAHGRKHQTAHHVAYELTYGPIAPGMDACHNCDVNYPSGDITYRRCARPDHVYPGTPSDNTRHMFDQGRGGERSHKNGPRGATHPRAVLTAVDVIWMRTHPEVSARECADQFGIQINNVYLIRKRLTWKHL